jgi:hypothetical protein
MSFTIAPMVFGRLFAINLMLKVGFNKTKAQPVNNSKREGWEGKGEACKVGREKQETRHWLKERMIVRYFNGGDLLHCFTG